jgi:carbon monoxide dehydrogenase subunit G
MRLEKQFDVRCDRDTAVDLLAQDETLVELFPDSETEVVASTADRKTTRTRYRALGREGTATFHFDYLLDGNVRFEKVCDGKVWKELRGEVMFEERGQKTRVRIAMEGRTKGFVPEFTIKGPMQEQLDAMARALRERLEGARA